MPVWSRLRPFDAHSPHVDRFGMLLLLTVGAVVMLSPTPQGGRFFGAAEPATSFRCFSLTTVTALGHGDPAPATDVARPAATAEALLGQVFLMTFVALVVGLFGERWRTRHRTEPDRLGGSSR